MTPYVSGIAVMSYLSGKLPSYDGKRLRTAAGMCSLSLPPGCRTRGLFLAVDLFRGLFHMFHDVPCRSEGVQRPARFSDCIRPCRCGVYPGFQQSFRHIDLAESDVYVGDRLAVEVAVDFRIFSAVGEVECTEDGDGCCDGREERGKTDTPALPGMAFGFTFCPPEETFGEQGIREAAGICGRCREGAEHGLRVCQVGRYRVADEEFPQLLFLCVGCRSVEVEGEQSSYLFIRCHNPLLL